MGALYSASDLIISRAGALALSEMAFMGKAMVLVPFPNSTGDHQFKNALAFSKSGAAIILPQFQLETGKLEKIVLELFQNPEKIREMEENSSQLAAPNATVDIINTIMQIAES
jgi:UDP-N-acetylglucosamine--N-acetylmuramyl-(pentapeptide) pyrophosphoryl-undecaprenol N-acetylglucosamine transferase